MKSLRKWGIVFLCLTAIASFGFCIQGNAKTNISYTVKGNTLTINGKGAIPKKWKLRANKKVTKVVIKKGITSIPNGLLSPCKSLKTISVPGNVKITGSLSRSMCRNTVTLIFTTPLKFNRDWFSCLSTRSLIVSRIDKKYTSVMGSIYTKDKSRLVMTPSSKEKIIIDNHCRILDTKAFKSPLSELTIPNSITTVINADKATILTDNVNCQITSMTEKLLIDLYDGIFYSNNKMWIDDLCKYYPQLVSCDNNFYVTTSGVLLTYRYAKQNTITVPKHVKIIHKHAFWYCRAEEIQLPEGLLAVEEEAFAFCEKLQSIKIPSTVTSLGEGAFCFCDYLSDVTLPEGLTTLPDYLFRSCDLTKITIPSTVHTLGKYTFYNCPLNTIYLGRNIKKIGAYCFSRQNPPLSLEPVKVLIDSDLPYLPEGNFCDNMILQFNRHPSWRQTNFFSYFPDSRLSKEIKSVSVEWTLVDGVSGYQLEFSTKKNFKKCIKKASLKNKQNKYSWKPKKPLKKLYGRIRPYSYVAGKRVYGKWNMVKFLSEN